jgi:hypothetical protein
MSDADSDRPGDGDKRRTRRSRVLLGGLVAYPDLSVSFRCAIRDRTAAGARLKLPDGMVVPERFWLIEVNEGLAHDTDPIWRRYPEVGVRFANPIDLRRAGEDLLQRQLRALWIEIAPRR